MSGEGRAGGNLHNVQVGELWRVQTLRSPYMCPILEADGVKFDPCGHLVMSIDPHHLQDGMLNDNCCYHDVEVLGRNDEAGVVTLRSLEDDGKYMIFEVLNDDTIVRFYKGKET